MESATLWLGLAGLLAIAVMMSRSFRGSVFIGIIFVTVIAWIPGHGASYLGAGSPIPGKLLVMWPRSSSGVLKGGVQSVALKRPSLLLGGFPSPGKVPVVM